MAPEVNLRRVIDEKNLVQRSVLKLIRRAELKRETRSAKPLGPCRAHKKSTAPLSHYRLRLALKHWNLTSLKPLREGDLRLSLGAKTSRCGPGAPYY